MKTLPSSFRNLAVLAAAMVAATSLIAQTTNLAAWGLNGDGQTDIPAGLGPIKKISAGANHCLALLTNGTVVAWGQNVSGQCNVPASATNIVDIAAGGFFSVARRSNGSLVSWGSISGTPTDSPNPNRTLIAAGANGHALAYGTTASPATVQTWGFTSGSASSTRVIPNVIALAAGMYHNVALDSTGRVYCWWPSVLPTPASRAAVTNVPSNLSNVIAIAAGDDHTLALQSNGMVVAWGLNHVGQTNVPTDLTNAVAIAAGGNQSLAVTANGKIISWGMSFVDPQSLTLRAAPLELTNIVRIATGSSHVLAQVVCNAPCLTQQPRSRAVPLGRSVLFSVGAVGQLPLIFQWQHSGTNLDTATNASLAVSNVTPADLGDYRVIVTNSFGTKTSQVAVLNTGSILAWGANTAEQCWVPARVTNAVAIAAGDNQASTIMQDGKVAAWGGVSPQESQSLASISNAQAIAAGSYGGLTIQPDRTVRYWSSLNLDLSAITALSNVVCAKLSTIDPRVYHVVSASSNGTVSASVLWDSFWFPPSSPDPITNNLPSLTNAVSLTTIASAAIALRNDGTVTGWGDSTAIKGPTNLNDVVQVTEGFNGYALRSGGQVARLTSSGTFTLVGGLTNAVQIAAGSFFLLALRSDGTVFVTGTDSYGAVNVPAGLSNVVEVCAGPNTSFARIGDGSPRVTIDPYSRPVHVGSNTTLTALGVGAQPLTYQWQFNGSDITDATNANYVLTNASLGSIGYRCVITNTFGAVTSAVANVSVVFDPPRFNLLSPPASFGTNGFSVRIESLSGQGPLVVYASTNLVDWLPILTNPAGPSQFDFLDPEATNQPLRFYKASEQR